MIRIIALVFAALVALPGATAAQDAAARGLQIVQEAERRDAGWKDARVGITMLLQDRRGATRTRELRMLMLEVPGAKGGDKSVAIFDSPADMRGTLMLTHTGIGRDDDQWLYLPSLKRAKRISSSNKTGAFFGSEFAYEDIATPEVGRFTYRYVDTRPCGGQSCFVVERKPAYRNSGYTALITWFDTREYRPLRIEFKDRRGKPFKTLTLSDYRKFQGRFWRAQTLTMENLRTGRKTVLKYHDWAFGVGLSDRTFDSNNLRALQ